MFLCSLSTLVCALTLAIVCQLIGWPWVEKAFPDFGGRRRIALLARLLAAFGIGLWIVSVAVMLWGMTVGLSYEKILVLWAALALGALRSVRGLARGWRDFASGLRLRRGEALATLTLGAIACLALVFALVPPIFTDAVRYHLGVPHRWMEAGSIGRLSHFSEQHLVMMWQHAELLLLGVGQPGAAKLFGWVAFPSALAAAGAASALLWGRPAAFWTALMLAGTPVLLGNSVLGGADAGLAFFTAMAWLFWRAGGSGAALWAGAMAGLAIGSKWQGTVVLAALLPVVWLEGRRSGRGIAPWVLSASALAVFLPWAIRNFLWSGDPIYPFLAQFWSAEAARVGGRFSALMATYGLAGEPAWQYLLYPLHLVLGDCPWWFGGRFEFESGIGALYLILLPWAAWAAFRLPAIRPLLVFCAIGLVLGLWQGQLPRFLLPVWTVFSIAAGALWARSSARIRTALACLLAAVSALNLAEVSRALNQPGFAPLAYFGCGLAPAEFTRRLSAEARAAEWVRRYDPSAKTLLVGLDGNLWWRTPVVVDGPFDDKTLVVLARDARDSAELARRLKAMGVRLIVADRDRALKLDRQFGYMGWDRETRERVLDFFFRRTALLHREGAVEIARIR